jgi:hypothetical protein
MQKKRLIIVASTVVLTVLFISLGCAGEPLQRCFIPSQQPPCGRDDAWRQGPTCAIELTCTDKPVQLGNSDGVCFRSTCAGVWAVGHKRADQASFRRRDLTYRHYAFTGTWELKDQGAIESVSTPVRELFLVLPEDLIEFKLRDPDPNAAIEVRNMGYLKKGSVEELKRWLAYQIYLERPQFRSSDSDAQGGQSSRSGQSGIPCGPGRGMVNPLRLIGRCLGVCD